MTRSAPIALASSPAASPTGPRPVTRTAPEPAPRVRLDDLAARFVTGDDVVVRLRPDVTVIDRAQVAPTNRGCPHSQQHLTRSGCRHRDYPQVHGAITGEPRSGHGLGGGPGHCHGHLSIRPRRPRSVRGPSDLRCHRRPPCVPLWRGSRRNAEALLKRRNQPVPVPVGALAEFGPYEVPGLGAEPT